MPKIIFILFFGFSFMLASAQHKTKINVKPILSKTKSIDSCLLLKELISKHWKLDTLGNWYEDSLRIFTNETFTNCLLHKTKSEIIKLLGVPNFTTFSYNEYHSLGYILMANPYYFDICSNVTMFIELNNNNRVKLIGRPIHCDTPRY